MKKQEGFVAPTAVALTWERHRRMESLCEGLGLRLYEMTHAGGGVRRYWHLGLRTILLLRRIKPKVLLVQNPSLVLTLLVCLLRRFLGRYRLIVDAHNEAVEPYIHTRWGLPKVARLLLRSSDLTIVTNPQLGHRVAAVGGRPFILPDRLPTPPIPVAPPPTAGAVFRVMVVSTYAPDEPIAEILEVASRTGDSFQFFVTGRDSKLSPALRARMSQNVRLTGFLEENDYWELMAQSHVVLDLTSMPDCLVCGAYEALALGRPMILTDNSATRSLFGEVAVVTDVSVECIESALMQLRAQYATITARMEAVRVSYRRMWSANAESLISFIHQSQETGAQQL